MRTQTKSLLEQVKGMEPDEVLEIRFAPKDEGAPSHRLLCQVESGVVTYRLTSLWSEMNSIGLTMGSLGGAKETDLMLPKKAVRGWQTEVYHWLTFLGHYEIISVR